MDILGAEAGQICMSTYSVALRYPKSLFHALFLETRHLHENLSGLS